MGLTFEEVFAQAQMGGYRGINVTYPYKELVTSKVTVTDPLVRAIGAVNTVVFEADGPKGFNTDYSGFVAAYRAVMNDAAAGTVCLIGTGGVGKAVAFGLIALKADVIRCVDLDAAKAQDLADASGHWARPPVSRSRHRPSWPRRGGRMGSSIARPWAWSGSVARRSMVRRWQGGDMGVRCCLHAGGDAILARCAGCGLAGDFRIRAVLRSRLDAWKIFTDTPVDALALRHAIQGDDL